MAAKIINKVEIVAEENCKNMAYEGSFLDGLNKMRVDQKLQYCDFTLEVDGDIVKVHKVALAIGSPYFAKMLETDMEEKRTGTVKLEEVDVRAVKALIHYMYNGTITLTKDDVEALLFAPDRFQIEWVKLQCEEFVKRNCLRILSSGDTPASKSLYDSVRKYILDHFDDLIEVEDLLLLPFDEIEKFIKDDLLTVKSEDDVYKAMLNWIKHDVNNRKIHLPELMSHITSTSNMKAARVCNSAISLNRAVYSMGGNNNGKELRTLECFNPVTKMWNYIAPMNNSHQDCGICNYDGFIYVVGGSNTSTVEKYSPAINSWQVCANIHTERYSGHTRSAVVKNNIYSIVDMGSHGPNACFRLDPREGWWYNVNEVGESSDDFELVCYDHSLFHIAYGCCKRLDVRMNQWESMPFLRFERYRFSAVIAADNIYVLGGKTSVSAGQSVTSVERFNIRTNVWATIESMEINHYRGGAAVVTSSSG
uniref:BTB domain-containing protein n=1 Tax=Glossina austeni TaxID=7395 RepID=A0A1A9VDI3_GLOAU